MRAARILVIGATGRTGRLVVAEALARGHRVTGFARRPEMVATEHPALTVLGGDGLRGDEVTAAVAHHDAVVSIVASGSVRRTTVNQTVARHLVAAMGEHGTSRLVVTSSHALVATRPPVLAPLVRSVLRHPFADAREMERIVRGSGLDWRIVRPTRLVDAPARGAVVRAPDGADFATGASVLPRADLAATILDVLEDDRLTRMAVEITGIAHTDRGDRDGRHRPE
ncbi:NAD(P)H-binding protein [Nocardioides sp. YIM 152315]|uniref:NAD(P)-dependent oxidoreductase n=1 Tax=Nocardioides sp. YIM 152315 TaxID=3031760 RepID=UPI0023D9FAE8|nr:NAD(P)H-binding protein [Nocardioides sp. YIM 152315]MDF1602470.1 NAD(P)H-binding protein [Nocardioides sp. YIM 152315]